MTNKQIARTLKQTAALIELTGGNPFRGRAFTNAARRIERLEPPATELLAAGTLTDVQGIGKGLAADIAELAARGSFTLRDDLLGAIPAGLLDVLQVKGLGAKKARKLWKERGITSLDALEAAAAAGHLATLDGFGARSEANILKNAQLLRAYHQRRRYADVYVECQHLLETLRATDAIAAASPTGALRRALDTLDAVAFVAAAHDPAPVLAALTPWHPEAPQPTDDGWTIQAALHDGLPLTVYVVPRARYGTVLWATTGNEAFCDAFTAQHGRPESHPDEAALFAAAGLPVVPPPLRETTEVLRAAAQDALPTLLTTTDLKGSLHNHSTYSDGAHTLQQMADAARAMGLSYFGICDHSQSLKIANGLTADRVADQQAEIARLNATYAADDGPPFRIFSGIESDILADGALDYPEEVLASFDFIVASIHSGFNMTEAEATTRLIRAIENPYTTILGHPTGRLLLAREGYPVDHSAVIAACARCNVSIELNANPYRLDLDWRHIAEATRQGVLISINPDAHAVEQLPYVRWGVAVAQKGGLTAAQCLNAMPLDAFEDWLSRRRA